MSKSQSNKRQRISSSKALLDSTSDDFAEESHQFRFHKRAKVEAACSKKKKATSKNTLSTYEFRSKSSSSKLADTKNLLVDIEEDVVTTRENCNKLEQILPKYDDKEASSLNDSAYSNEIFNSDDEHTDFIALEKSICSHSERLCPSCKHIVESSAFTSHFTECLKKFSYNKGKKQDDRAQKEDSSPCPVCLKALNTTIQRSAHIKNCAQFHGLSAEQLILASRLQEKQIEERLTLGLPVQTAASSGVGKKEPNKGVVRAEKDLDLELAVALSCSLAEEEKGKREQEEDTLLSLGLPILIQERRRTNQLILPPSTAVIHKVKPGRRRRNAYLQQKTVLMTRSKEDREQIINEKVAAILTNKPPFTETNNDLQVEPKGVLKHFQDKNCTLWSLAHGDSNLPVEDNYVPELQDFIIKREEAVGALLKHFSQVPGRLNFTVSMEDSEDSETDDNDKPENPETTIVDNYCTQLALAELLGSQEDLAEFSFDEVSVDKNKSNNEKNIENDSKINVKKLNESNKWGSFTNINGSSYSDKSSPTLKILSQDTKNEQLCSEFINIVSPETISTSVIKSSEEVFFKNCANDASTNTSFNKEYEEYTRSHLLSNLMTDWNKVLCSGEWCDILILTNLNKIPCHSLVLQVRCPEIMKECYVKPNELQKYINLNSIEHESVHKFLIYLYSGAVDIKSKNEPCWMELFDLAIKYNCKDLISFLESIYKSPFKCLEQNVEKDLGDDVREDYSTMMISSNAISEMKCSDVTVIDVSTSPSPEPDLPTGKLALENVGTSLRRNKVDFTSLDGSSSTGRFSELGCNTFSPDIFEETVNFGDFVRTPVLTPPGIIESGNEIKSLNEMEIFEKDEYDHHHSMRRRKLFTETIEGSNVSKSAVDVPDIPLDEFNSSTAKNESSSLQNSPVNDVDGIVDLTMSSDDSQESGPSQTNSITELGDKILLDRTLPFDSTVVENVNEPSNNYSTNSLNDTLPFQLLDNQPNINLISTATNDCVSKEVIDITEENSDPHCKNLQSNTEECNYSKNSTHFQDILSQSNFILLTDKGQDLPNGELKRTSPTVEPVSSPPKNDSIISNVWDNFDDGDYYLEYPTKGCTPLKQSNLSVSKQNEGSSLEQAKELHIKELNVSLMKDKDLSPLKQIENVHDSVSGCNNFPDNFKYLFNKHNLNSVKVTNALEKIRPLKDANYVKEINNSFSDVGNDTLLIAVNEVETQIVENVKENAPQIKKSRLYKSKSCNLDTASLRPSTSPLKTPISFKKWGHNNITPMPDYRTMVSPELKKELDRYGIRKLSRKKAITLLTHIYDQLHPVVSDSEVDTSYFETPDTKGTQGSRHFAIARNRASPKKRSTVSQKSPNKSKSSTEELNTSRSSLTSNDVSDDDCLEESAFFSGENDKDEISLTQQGSFETRMMDLIKHDASLHEKILFYEPIWANELHVTAKANGIKCSMPTLIDFLDRQCITFRLPTTRNRKGKGKKSPTKKSKHKAATQDI